jgi:hypothetical protein
MPTIDLSTQAGRDEARKRYRLDVDAVGLSTSKLTKSNLLLPQALDLLDRQQRELEAAREYTKTLETELLPLAEADYSRRTICREARADYDAARKENADA